MIGHCHLMAGDGSRMAGGESRMTGDCCRTEGSIHRCVRTHSHLYSYIYGLVALLENIQSSFSSITISTRVSDPEANVGHQSWRQSSSARGMVAAHGARKQPASCPQP